MMNRQSHILNVTVSTAQRSPRTKERVLVIETDLNLPQSRFSAPDPRIEDLLMELHALKMRNPALFQAVDTVEIRGADDHIGSSEDTAFPFVSGERVPSALAVNMPGA